MKFKKMLIEENGQSLVLVAIFLTVLIGFAGLAIDGGRLYLAKSQLQKAVDAGVLAGADLMVGSSGLDYTNSHDGALLIAEENYGVGDYDVTFPGSSNIIQVEGSENVSLLLMPVLGMDKTTTVEAVAQAEIGGLYSIESGLIPIGLYLEENQSLTYGDTWNLTKPAGNALTPGNYLLLDFSTITKPGEEKKTCTKIEDADKGAVGVGTYILEGSPVPVDIGYSLCTQTGAAVNSQPISEAIDNVEGEIVFVPIITEPGDGKGNVTITGFAAFIIDGIQGGSVVGTFLQTVAPGDVGTIIKDYGTYASKLIK